MLTLRSIVVFEGLKSLSILLLLTFVIWPCYMKRKVSVRRVIKLEVYPIPEILSSSALARLSFACRKSSSEIL